MGTRMDAKSVKLFSLRRRSSNWNYIRKSSEVVENVMRRVWSKVMPFPYSHGLQFAKFYKWLMKTQWLPPEELEEIRNERLKIIVKHAYENVPYYRRIFEERSLKPKNIQLKEDLKLLPILTKDDVRKHFNELIAKDFTKYKPVLSHTSGSTGIPMKFYLDKNNLILEHVFVSRHWAWMGCSPKEKQAVLRGAVPKSKGYFLINGNNLILSSFSLDFRTLNNYINAIVEFKPRLIRGYPSSLHFFVRLLKEKNVFSIRPKAIQTSSETLFPQMREEIEDVFRCKVYDLYGNGEHVSMISECSEEGFHINQEYGVIEFLNEKGYDAKHGELAEMACTGLNNFSMPLIRYKIGDVAVPTNKKCSCGRGLPLVEHLEGRIDDLIITPDGRTIPPAGMTLAFEFSENIKQCQLVQNKKDELVINIVKSDQYGEKDHKFMLNEVRKRIGNEMKITVSFVDAIPRTNAGKLRFVVSKAKLEDII